MIANAEFARAKTKFVRWWNTEFPVEDILNAIDENTHLILLASPNNPTGQLASLEDIKRIRAAKPDAILVIDAVYALFANHDITAELLELENTAVIRSFSKEYGSAGLRVGYVVSSNEEIIAAIRTMLDPYAVAAASAHIVHTMWTRPDLQQAIGTSINTIIENRDRLQDGMKSLDINHINSFGNFVTAQFASPEEADLVFHLLAGAEVGTKDFKTSKDNEVRSSLRFGVPAKAPNVERLLKILEACKRPECIFVDKAAVREGGMTEAQIQDLVTQGYRVVAVAREGRPSPLFRLLGKNPGGDVSRDAGTVVGNDLRGIMRTMGVTKAWYLGPTPDSIREAHMVAENTKGQSVVIPFGISSEGGDPEMLRAGAARVVGPGEFCAAVKMFPPANTQPRLTGLRRWNWRAERRVG